MKAVMTAVLMIAVSANANWYNTNTAKETSRLPNPLVIGTIAYSDPTPAKYADAGYVAVLPFHTPEGYVREAGTRRLEISGSIVQEVYDVITQAEYDQQVLDARADSIDAEVMAKYTAFHADFTAGVAAAIAAGAQLDPSSVTYESLISALSQLEGEQWGRLANALTARWNAVTIVSEHKHGWGSAAVYYDWLPVMEYRRVRDAQ